MMGTLFQDVRYGLRMLAKNPGFTAVAVITLALGIGANTAIFSVANAVLLRPLPYKQPDELVKIYSAMSTGGWGWFAAPADFLDWKVQNQVFEDIAAIDWDADPILSPSQGGEAVKVQGMRVSANFFSILGVQPALGRVFALEEDQPGRDNVVVLGYGLWQRRFGRDPAIVGKAVTLDDESYTVIGIMPQSFQFRTLRMNRSGDLWLPNPFKEISPTQRESDVIDVVARLKPGMSLAQAQANMDTIGDGLRKAYPDTHKQYRVSVQPLQKELVHDVRKPLLLLLAAVSFVLLIACVNVANLLLARAARRQKEIGIRVAVGAGRARLIRQLLTESLLLSLVGGALGLLLALWGTGALIALSPAELSRAEAIGVDLHVLAFTLLVSLLAGALFGLAPALGSSKPDLNQSLKEAGRSSGESLWGRRFRGLLVVGEIALSLMLLVGAGLVVNSFFRLLWTDPGFDPGDILAMQIDLVRPRYADVTGLGTRGWGKGTKLWTVRPRRWTFVQDVLRRIQALPGVESAAAVNFLPVVGGYAWYQHFTVEGRPNPTEHETAYAFVRPVTTDYFHAMRTPLLKGRLFTDADQGGAEKVAIIDQALARRYFGHQNPVGKRVRASQSVEEGEKVYEIVGVVGAVRESGLDSQPIGVMYFPYFQQPQAYSQGAMWFVMKVCFIVRTASNSTGLAAGLRKAVWDVDKYQPIEKIQPMQQFLSDSVSSRRFYVLLLGAFAAVALVLAAAGIYGVVAYSVSQRTHEIGLRMALGAGRSDVLKLVVGQGLVLTLVGVAFGVSGAIALTRYLQSFLYGVGPLDRPTFVVVSAALSAVALLASYIPARRATKVDPMVALRYE